jgi:hypothetical protein
MTRFWALAALLLAGCSSLPPQPEALSQTALVLSFKTEGMLFSWADAAQRVALAPLKADGSLDLDQSFFPTLRRGARLYYLNLPPGRYAPVAAYWTRHGLRHAVRVPSERAKEFVVETKSGEFRFMGNIRFKRRWENWPRFLLNGLKSGRILLPPFRPAVSFVDAIFKLRDASKGAEAKALRAALEDLAGTEWTPAIRARLLSLKLPAEHPVEIQGFFRRREVPAPIRWTPVFGWVDTLEWGEPFEAGGGLEWRHPSKEARIQVALRTSPPFSRALETLKGLGSPEDSHVHRETLISTRTAYAVRYTTYHYPEPYLTGAVVKVSITETLLVPQQEGYWVVQLRAARDEFSKVLPAFVRFRNLLRLHPEPKEDK